MRSIILFLEALVDPKLQQPLLPLSEKPLPAKPPTRLTPQLLNLMRKDPDLAAQVATDLKNSENIGRMRARHMIKM